jgi:predicted lipoprotein with Yx(FWY)xxD motif
MRNLVRISSGRLLLASASLLIAGAGVSGTAIASAGTFHPQAKSATGVVNKSATIVKQATRRHFGKMLVTLSGRALYYQPTGSCNSVCLQTWPRLGMPAGKTIPKGAACLGTKSFGTHHQLQVTYRKHRLYTFTLDSGNSVTGNGLMGFVAAKTVPGCR